MKNQRRRKEVLLFAVLLSASTDIVAGTKHKALYQAVYRHVNVMDRKYKEVMPNEAERNREIRSVQMLVNGILPVNWHTADDEWRLWFCVQLLYRMIASGWPVPRDPELADFVQSMYQLSQNFNLEKPPTQPWINKVAQAPEILRKAGLFR